MGLGSLRHVVDFASDALGMTGVPCLIRGHAPWWLVNPEGRIVGLICRRCGRDL